jgi:hypothetical protein
MADGSCCNRYDSCYLDDPGKKCFNGKCESSDTTLCKGYCTVDADCSPTLVPLKPGLDYETTFCLYGSCATLIAQDIPVVSSPAAFLLEDTQAELNITSCLYSQCVSYEPAPETVCLYTFNCAPFVFSKKRAALDSQTVQTLNFNYPGVVNSGNYLLLSEKVNNEFQALLASTPTAAPTPAPTEHPTVAPTVAPTTHAPTHAPTAEPTASAAPTAGRK